MKKVQTNGQGVSAKGLATEKKTEADRLRTLVRNLRADLRKERSAKKALAAECAGYRQALLQQFMKSCKEEDWQRVREESFKYSLEDILAEWKQEQGK